MRVSLKWVAIGLTALLVVMLIHKQFGDSRDDRDSGRRSKAKKEKNGKEKKTKEEKEETDKGDAGSTDADEAEKLNRYGHKPRMKRNEQLKRLEETGAVRWDVRMLKVAGIGAGGEQMEFQEANPDESVRFKPIGERPKPPKKIKVKHTKTAPYKYPEWYASAVKRSKVNPCWWEGSGKNAKLRCLPFFYVAGVAKCGTTDFYRRLRYHPDIMWGELKEYHWWDRLRYGSSMELKFLEEEGVKNEEPMPLSKYSEIITGDEIEDVARELKKDGFSELICGDGSPSYLWDNSQWVDFVGNEGCTEPRIVAGSFIKDAYPDSRIFLLFRQPTQRVYSRFLSRIPRVPAFKNATPAMFHDYVVKGVQIYKDCFKRASIRECAYNEDVYDEAVIRLNEGLYSVYVEDWLRIFKREQIMVIRNEDYSENVEGTMISAFIWLGMAPLTDAQLKPIVEHVSVNTGQNYGVVGPMLPETIEILNEFYAPFNARLAELLEDDRFLWKDIIVT
nr:hypothetical protein BaRGS_026209 [Batillaria attramentaria]